MSSGVSPFFRVESFAVGPMLIEAGLTLLFASAATVQAAIVDNEQVYKILDVSAALKHLARQH